MIFADKGRSGWIPVLLAQEGGKGKSPERDMDKMIRELYGSMLQETGGMDRISRETKEEVVNLLSGEEKKMGEEEYAKYKDAAFYIACAAEENGFVKGFKYAFRLFAECVRE